MASDSCCACGAVRCGAVATRFPRCFYRAKCICIWCHAKRDDCCNCDSGQRYFQLFSVHWKQCFWHLSAKFCTYSQIPVAPPLVAGTLGENNANYKALEHMISLSAWEVEESGRTMATYHGSLLRCRQIMNFLQKAKRKPTKTSTKN